jgi:N-acetylated-alpha-linked acidic dipeptidase
MKTDRALLPMFLALAICNSTMVFGQGSTKRLTGYTTKGTNAQKDIEKRFQSIPSRERARSFHRYFTAEPHPAGSERNNELGRYISRVWREQGLEDVKIHRYDVLVSYPRTVEVEMTSPIQFRASLREDAYDVDPDTKNPNVRQGYIALSASGEVTAPIVYAHSGNPEDYALLRKHGISVKGKIALVRYSNPYSYRGFKALTAEREGAAAILIYSDPAEDGYVRGKVFPDGPWGPASHIQRGAITYDFMVAGDPLSPGWASVPGAKRIPIEDAISVPKIIAVPLSWRDAKPLLENMDGPKAPEEWQGGLPISYRLGGKSPRVRVKADMDTRVAPNYVIEGRVTGSDFPDEWVLLGNHRDAWEFGAVDPSSGTASMMELSRALGELKMEGIRPKRTIILCSWDGEEVGLTGSTEWGEQFAEELKQKLVAYINVDSTVSGPTFEPSAVASLAPFLLEVSQGLKRPDGKSLYEALNDQKAKGRASSISNLVNVRIGSGSDHTVFLNFLGRPTIGLAFEGPYGVYHSMYDNFYWMNQFGDPGYHFHVLMAQLWGVLALRLSNAEILPFAFDFYAENIREFVNEVEAKEGASEALDFRSAYLRINEFGDIGRRLHRESAEALDSGPIAGNTRELINRNLMRVEGNWLNPDGIPGRPWFKHILYAARYTYAHLELPGLTEAVENREWQTARAQLRLLESALAKNTALLQEAVTELQKSNPPKR